MLLFPRSTYCSYILVKWRKIQRYPAVWLVLTLRRRTTSFWEPRSCDFKLRLDWTFLEWRQLCLHVCSCEALPRGKLSNMLIRPALVSVTGSGLCHIIDLYIYVCLQLWLSLEMNFLFKLKQERFWIESLKLILCFTDAPSLWFRVNIDLLHSLQDYLCIISVLWKTLRGNAPIWFRRQEVRYDTIKLTAWQRLRVNRIHDRRRALGRQSGVLLSAIISSWWIM